MLSPSDNDFFKKERESTCTCEQVGGRSRGRRRGRGNLEETSHPVLSPTRGSISSWDHDPSWNHEPKAQPTEQPRRSQIQRFNTCFQNVLSTSLASVREKLVLSSYFPSIDFAFGTGRSFFQKDLLNRNTEKSAHVSWNREISGSFLRTVTLLCT